jgi:hypothetical protein
MMSETEDKLARELGWKIHYKGADGYILEHPANSETITSFASDSLSGKLWRKCLELTEQRKTILDDPAIHYVWHSNYCGQAFDTGKAG